MESMLQRFIRYAKINTRSDLHSDAVPTTPGQLDFLRMLEGELKDLGLSQVRFNPVDAFVTALLPKQPAGPSKGASHRLYRPCGYGRLQC